ncbi:MAG: RHS repeat-associated core domain-containing protein [Paludibacteraceae bacterium]|nr:RHS repeat-associated core domain-containing protein [Paludibacteraceae bacterium]
MYIPYGDFFVEERNGSWTSLYLFIAKELDEETGLYYYGARYLNPSIALWLSTDPLQGKYPGMSPYNYCAGNPVKLVDPDGRSTDITDNGDGSYTVINAYNDKDCNIYVVDSKGNRTGELFGKTLLPFDFLSTEGDGSFSYKKGETNVTFSYDDLWLTGSFPDDLKEMINYNNMDASDCMNQPV